MTRCALGRPFRVAEGAARHMGSLAAEGGQLPLVLLCRGRSSSRAARIPVAVRSPRADALVGGPRADRPPNSTAPRGSADYGDQPAKRKARTKRWTRNSDVLVCGLVSVSMMIGRLGGPRHATDAIAGSRPDAVASTATLDHANVRSSDILRQDYRGIVRVDRDQDSRRDAGGAIGPTLPRIEAPTVQRPVRESWFNR